MVAVLDMAESFRSDCTLESHEQMKSLGRHVLCRARWWDEAEAWIGECPACQSSLMIHIDEEG
jgi:hypothetical protein